MVWRRSCRSGRSGGGFHERGGGGAAEVWLQDPNASAISGARLSRETTLGWKNAPSLCRKKLLNLVAELLSFSSTSEVGVIDNRYVTVESWYNEPCDITDNVKTNRLSGNIFLSYRTLNYGHSDVSVTFHVLSVTRSVCVTWHVLSVSRDTCCQEHVMSVSRAVSDTCL